MKGNDLFRKKSIERILHDAEKNDRSSLVRNLSVRDLTALGVAAIIGAGIFSTIGTAAASGGPAVSVLFVFTALACGFSALCYAQFASMIPIAGSAYTYAYASFGELIAWIIGWDLIMEYAVGNIAVAISWSDYFTALFSGLGIHIPAFCCVDYLSASRGFEIVTQKMQAGISLDQISLSLKEAYLAWQQAPMVFGIRMIADIPAFTIVVFITYLVYRGIYETKVANNIMVALKITILLVVIIVGAFYVNTDNWSPFAPHGLSGVLKGVAGVFFAYIGFDAISTTAEECKNPRRDLPRSMIYSLLITTVLYVLISLVLTGMVPFHELGVGDPLAYAFQKLHLTRLSGVIAISAVIAMAGVLLVFQVGQPRIWMSMSRDGLLPPIFSKLHPHFKTPGFSTILTGIIVAVPSLFLNLTEVTELTSIGTLFAFILVSGGVLVLGDQLKRTTGKKQFIIPYINSRYVLPLLWLVVIAVLFIFNNKGMMSFYTISDLTNQEWLNKIPMLSFIGISIIITLLAIIKKWSIIPVLGLLTNLYLITELGITNWMRFLIWLVVGLALYFAYGSKHSKLIKA